MAKASRNPFLNQIDNRNFLSSVGFKFTLAKYPKVDFYSNSARIPEIQLGLIQQPTYLKDIDVPGEKLTYGDLNLRFLVDENMENYMAIHNWLTGLGFPETPDQFRKQLLDDEGQKDYAEQWSDGNLSILNSNFRTTANVKFKDLFPISLSSLDFDATLSDVEYFTAEVFFKYTIYNIVGSDNRTPL